MCKHEDHVGTGSGDDNVSPVAGEQFALVLHVSILLGDVRFVKSKVYGVSGPEKGVARANRLLFVSRNQTPRLGADTVTRNHDVGAEFGAVIQGDTGMIICLEIVDNAGRKLDLDAKTPNILVQSVMKDSPTHGKRECVGANVCAVVP